MAAPKHTEAELRRLITKLRVALAFGAAPRGAGGRARRAAKVAKLAELRGQLLAIEGGAHADGLGCGPRRCCTHVAAARGATQRHNPQTPAVPGKVRPPPCHAYAQRS